MRLRFVTLLSICLALGVSGQTRAQDLREIERRISPRYVGQVVLVRMPDQGKYRLELPKEARSDLADQQEFLLRVEGIILKKKEVEIRGRQVFRFEGENGEGIPVEGLSRKYRLRWKQSPRDERGWNGALEAAIVELTQRPTWLQALPAIWSERPGQAWKSVASRPSEEISPGLYTLGSDTTPLKCIHCPDPEYTPAARDARVQGVVRIQAILHENGHVSAMRIEDSLNHGLDRQLIAAVSHWRFEPILLGGQPIKVLFFIETSFHLY